MGASAKRRCHASLTTACARALPRTAPHRSTRSARTRPPRGCSATCGSTPRCTSSRRPPPARRPRRATRAWSPSGSSRRGDWRRCRRCWWSARTATTRQTWWSACGCACVDRRAPQPDHCRSARARPAAIAAALPTRRSCAASRAPPRCLPTDRAGRAGVAGGLARQPRVADGHAAQPAGRQSGARAAAAARARRARAGGLHRGGGHLGAQQGVPRAAARPGCAPRRAGRATLRALLLAVLAADARLPAATCPLLPPWRRRRPRGRVPRECDPRLPQGRAARRRGGRVGRRDRAPGGGALPGAPARARGTAGARGGERGCAARRMQPRPCPLPRGRAAHAAPQLRRGLAA